MPTNNSNYIGTSVSVPLSIYTIDDTAMSVGWYSENNGVTNRTFAVVNDAITNITMSWSQVVGPQSYIVLICANDTDNNIACSYRSINVQVDASPAGPGGGGGVAITGTQPTITTTGITTTDIFTDISDFFNMLSSKILPNNPTLGLILIWLAIILLIDYLFFKTITKEISKQFNRYF